MKTVRPSLQAGIPGSPPATSNGRPEMADARSANRLPASTSASTGTFVALFTFSPRMGMKLPSHHAVDPFDYACRV